ncbi:mannose-6-phosphate isomerase, class I [Nocardiopsis salina]|uniref:mannose-6-phosphate isomerase, class I n=1 Tax=Nocardiopsis salina TaxID=245836 RepID=UPI00034979C6|nr:mannose-6-phosphate isomerase, class I [Nocardiopsis salina]
MHRLTNQVRPYAWGARTAIPDLLGTEPDGSPQAELWLGAHHGAPSAAVSDDGSAHPLPHLIADAPHRVLGSEVAERFGARLPFLLKYLAAEQPLSLQVHPDAARARQGFDAEESSGIPVDAPHRNYRDPHHKPELLLALEPFEALCGFREPEAARHELRGMACELACALRADLASSDDHTALRSALTRLLTLSDDRRERLLSEFVEEWSACDRRGPHGRIVPDLAHRYPGDPGAVASLLLNRITLWPGEALFLPAGNLHAYLQGTAIEVMASSDNVLRAGLTRKHVDATELLDVVDFSVLPIPYAQPAFREGRREFRPGAPEFALHEVGPGRIAAHLPGTGPCVVLALDGQVDLVAEVGQGVALDRGQSVFVPADSGPVKVEGRGHVVAATVGAASGAALATAGVPSADPGTESRNTAGASAAPVGAGAGVRASAPSPAPTSSTAPTPSPASAAAPRPRG